MLEHRPFVPRGGEGSYDEFGIETPSQPFEVGDEIWFYYMGQDGRNWWNYKGDPPKLDPKAKEPRKGIGLATLRLDGFVSVETKKQGTLTTKPLVFLGDTIVVNANAKGGSLAVEALDADGKVIEGFTRSDCAAITTDSVRHVVTWKGNPDCHLLQARPIRLRFHLKNAKLYSFAPAVRHNHYLQSYD